MLRADDFLLAQAAGMVEIETVRALCDAGLLVVCGGGGGGTGGPIEHR